MCRPADVPPYDEDRDTTGYGRLGAAMARDELAARRHRRVLYTEPEDAPVPEWRDPADPYRDLDA